jgi:hypothetical protein
VSTLHVLVMTFRTYMVLAVSVVLIAACGDHTSSRGSHPAPSAARPLSCAQQFQNWRHGPAHAPASTLQAALNQIQAAGQSGDVAGMRAAMKKLVPAALAMADHPMPHCADPDSLYPDFVTRIYTAGDKARSAHGLSALLRAAAPLKGLKKIGHQMAAEINRAMGKKPVTANSSQPAT